MNTRQIRRILHADIYVRRCPNVQVCSRDMLPSRLDRSRTACFVINTDTSDLPGSHWVALFYTSLSQFEYFDSFGLPPLHREIASFIRNNSDRPLVYNGRALQDINNSTCGLYAIHFLTIKARGGSMQRVLASFPASHRQRVNDSIVTRLIAPLKRKAAVQ
jgi:hypothetical protein